MIEVERLTKRFGGVLAVDRLDFAIGRGQVVGLLGPNGAGKTTTMRLLTTFLLPTSGRARLAGHDVTEAPLDVRRNVGYLPENVPLYPEMRVREYLDYRARLKGVGRASRRPAIERSIDRAGLPDVADRVIGHLSKGYRQRVGLADAMLHDPPILILDEPTAGLDPIQVREVRALVRELGDRHTVLLSTHILPEVEVVCGRVLVIVGGRVAADESIDARGPADGLIVAEVRGPADAARRTAEAAPGVARVLATEPAEDGWLRLEIRARPGEDPRAALASRWVREGMEVRLLDLRRSSLEDRFVRAVSRAGRDEPEAA